MAKYHNRKTTLYGLTFDSQAEAARYCDLLLLQEAGEIYSLECQPTFLLLEGFTDCAGKREHAIKYTADFAYRENGRHVVEDVKSRATKKSRDWPLRRKLFKSKYPTIELREVMA